jgi:CDP-6-deoxy-D-xylo-4-hexulose-3-dehydrase
MDVELEGTSIEGVYLVHTPVHGDDRGYLQEIHQTDELSEYTSGGAFKRSFYSSSKSNVLRGLHIQERPYRQSKLVTCLSGKVFDVAVDLREHSDSYGQTVTATLSGTGTVSLLIPRGFAHGFVSLSDDTVIHYLSDNDYAPSHETGVYWASRGLDIDWPVENPIVSEKDSDLPTFSEYSNTVTDQPDEHEELDQTTASVPPVQGDTDYRVLYAKARYGQRERERVNDVLDDPTSLIRGQYTREFESRVAERFGKEHGVMVNSGSSANLLALELLDLPPGSEVITPMLTFSTTVAPLIQLDLVPRFVDIRRSDFQIDVERLKQTITPDTEAILVPSLIGLLPNYEALSEIVAEHDIHLVEDSADTIGARWDGTRTGEYTDLTTTSFYASHVVTGFGGGGMVCIDDDDMYRQALKFRGWGRRAEANQTDDIEDRLDFAIGGIPYDEKFVFDEIGYNFLPLEASAAFGTAQLERLETFTACRKQNYRQLRDAIAEFDHLGTASIRDEMNTAPLAFPLTVSETAPFDRRDIVTHLERNEIQTRSLWSGMITEQPGFEGINCQLPDKPYEQTAHVMRNSFVVGCHQSMDSRDVAYVVNTIERFLEQYE